MALPFYNWSRTAATNASADATVNWAEGQPPSSVNDSARAMMASTAAFRDDISGATVTAGTSTAYTLSSYQVFDTFAHLAGQMLAFTPHATNGATVTLNVDGLGAKPLRPSPGVELSAGILVQGSPYLAIYNNSDQVFYLQGFYGTPYNVPLLGGMDYWDTVAPNSSFIIPVGQAISRTTYSYAFSRWSTTFGAGDGSTTFNVPDMRGTIAVPADNMGGSQAFRINNILTNPIGSRGGEQQHVLLTAEVPAHFHSVFLTDPTHTHSNNANVTGIAGVTGGGSFSTPTSGAATISAAGTGLQISNGLGTQNVTGNAGSNTTHNNVQPSIVCYYIIRVL